MLSQRLKILLLYLVQKQIITFALNKQNNFDKSFEYLNRQRPLWILEDQVSSMERDISHISLTTTVKPQYLPYHLEYRRKKTMPQAGFLERTLPNPQFHVSLPRRYIYGTRKPYKTEPETYKKNWRRQQPLSIPVRTETFVPSMPIFDSMPNDIDATDDGLAPIFIYNGPKGELIMNTMLSTQKYPMQEPVPGEILYPPTVPIFRPKPIVQQFRMPDREQTMNLTFIPFYAHEAIVPHFLYTRDSRNSAELTDSTSLTSSAVIYAASAPEKSSSATTSTTTESTSTPTTTTTSRTPKLKKKRRHKKAKHYAVYHSPEEVHWRPTEPTLQRISGVTTPYPMVLANPLKNHRYSKDTIDLTTTLKPITNFKLTYKDEDSNFQIVYVDESLEKPISQEVMPTRMPSKQLAYASTPNPLPTLSSHYSREKEYYAFPVYTLGKLLKPYNSEKPRVYSSQFPNNENPKMSSKKNVDTWFIMNSRYKGHRVKDGLKRLSSKYIEVSPASDIGELTKETAETTLETSLLR